MAIDSRKLDAVFTETIRKANKGAISAIIFNEDSILYEAYDGWIDKKNRRKPADDSLYMIGSNTKVMTTLGLMRLWEDGKLDPQDDIRRYIPEFSVKSRMGDYPFTIEDFLMHRTGLVCDMYRYMTDGQYTYRDIVDGLHESWRTSLPTQMFSYSNLGYTLLGIVIERASGMAYADFLQKYLFEPLGMEVYFASEQDLPENVRDRIAQSHDSKGIRQMDPLGCCIPAGAHTYTTITGLMKMAQLILNRGKAGIAGYVGRYDTVFGPLAFALSDQGKLVLRSGEVIMKTETFEDGWISCILPRPLKTVPEGLRVLGNVYLKQAVYFGHPVLIMDNNGTKTVIGCRYTEPCITENWLNALGTYKPHEGLKKEFFDGMDLQLKDGELILTLKIIGEKLKYYLHVLSDEEAIVKGYGRNCRQTVTLRKEKGHYVLECDGVKARR